MDERLDMIALDYEAPPVIRRRGGLRLRAAYLQSYVGAAFAIFLVVASGILGLSYAMEVRRHGIWDTALFSAALLGWMFLDLPYFGRLWSEIGRDNPEAVLTVALRQPRAAAPLRPLIAIWWLSHFAVGCAFAFWFERVSAGADLTSAGVLSSLLRLFLSFGGAYAANGFLAMAVGAISTRECAVQAVWRYRVLLDLGIAIGACVVALV